MQYRYDAVGPCSRGSPFSIHHYLKIFTLLTSLYHSYTSIYIVQSFHFAPRRQGETFDESVYRLEHYLALRTGMDGSKKVLDVGCGVGGPMRNIAAFTGADITGVTINEYQVRVANKYNEQKGLDKSCR